MKTTVKLTYMIDALDTDLAGTENQLIKMINGLGGKGFEIRLVCFKDHPWLRKNAPSLACKTEVIELNQFKKPHTYGNCVRLVRFLRSSSPDIVHTFFPMANILGVIAARMAGTKVILSSRRDYGEWMNGRYMMMTRFANRFTTKILANSYKVKELTMEKEGVDSSRIEVFLNGIDTSRFENVRPERALKKSLGIADGNRVVGIVANFRPMKHHTTFLMAAREMLRQRDDVTFLLIGTGPLKEEMERLSRTLGIAESVRFTNSQKDVIPYLSIMDVGVNCSEGEGLSNAIMEYMSAGVPCVVSEAGGNTDLITNGYNGYTFKIDDHKTLASLILELFDDDAKRELFARNALDTIKNKMSLEVILSKYENFYKSLVNA
ncbi:MAG: glycosyltransferase [Deltaproteobacteria bacterium]|nr:glycosyltransferase [Deltaproteobacteria bacterium]